MNDDGATQDACSSKLIPKVASLEADSAPINPAIGRLLEEMAARIGADRLLFAFAHINTREASVCHCVPENDETLKVRIPNLLARLSEVSWFPMIETFSLDVLPRGITADWTSCDRINIQRDRAELLAAVYKIDQTQVGILMVALPQGTEMPDLVTLQFAVISLAQSLEIRRLNQILRLRKGRIEEVERMATLSTLAYSMFHDLNNNLAVVQGYAEMILSDADSNLPDRAFVEAIAEAGIHATDTIEQLLAYRRLKRERTQAVNLERLLDHIDLPAQVGPGTATRVCLHTPQEELTFASNQKELAAALAGLCRKVGASIDGTDELVLEAGLMRIANDRPATHGYLQRGPYVRISLFGGSSDRPPNADTGRISPPARDPLRSDRELSRLLATLQLLRGTVDFRSTNARDYQLDIYFKTLAETT